MNPRVSLSTVEKECTKCKKTIWTDQNLHEICGYIENGEKVTIDCTCSCGHKTLETIQVFINIKDISEV